MAQVLDPLTSTTTTSADASTLAEVSKQATKALKCVASTSKQVGDILARKHERIIKRICSISEEIESLNQDVMENIAHQRERRQQLSEIEEDIDQAQLLGNGTIVEELVTELHVLREETQREDTLYRALCKTVRSRKASRKQFMRERAAVEDEIRGFDAKQKLIQTLLATCSQQSSCSEDTQGSSASQSDCGASALEDDDEDNVSGSGSSDSPVEAAAPVTNTAQISKQKWLAKSVSLDTASKKPVSPKRLRVRSLSSDCVSPAVAPEASVSHPPQRSRRSLSVHFAPSPILTSSNAHDSELAKDLDSLDLSGYMESIQETTPPPVVAQPAPVVVATPPPQPPQPVEPVVAAPEPKPEVTAPATPVPEASQPTPAAAPPAVAKDTVTADAVTAQTPPPAPRTVEVDGASVDPVKVTITKIEAVLASAKPLEGSAKSLNAVFGTTVA